MIRKKKGAIEWLEFELFADHPEFIHAVFLRHGGVSLSPFHSLNASKHTDDRDENVEENLRLMCKVLDVEGVVRGKITHNATVAHVTEWGHYPTADGLITDRRELALGATHADCQIALFFDPIREAFATVHCGWRGNVQNIYKETIKAMQKSFGSDPSNLLVAIGPSLGPQAAEFIHYKSELPDHFLPYKLGEHHFDLWEISRMQLLKEGILAHHIQIAGICTYHNRDDFFSYRGEKPLTGRNLTLAAIKKTCNN